MVERWGAHLALDLAGEVVVGPAGGLHRRRHDQAQVVREGGQHHRALAEKLQTVKTDIDYRARSLLQEAAGVSARVLTVPDLAPQPHHPVVAGLQPPVVLQRLQQAQVVVPRARHQVDPHRVHRLTNPLQ